MADCFELNQNINDNANCDLITNFKAETKGYYIPVKNVDSKTIHATIKTICTEIALKAGKNAYSVTMRGMKPFDGTKITGKEVPYGIAYDHESKIIVYGNTPSGAEIVKQIDNTAGYLVYEQAAYQGTSAAFVILAFDGGFNSKGGTFEPYSDKGGWEVPMSALLQTNPVMFLQYSAGANDQAKYETTLTALEAMLV